VAADVALGPGPEGGARDPLSLVFAALADPTRRAILTRLRSGPASVAELGGPFRMSGPAVSKHLRVLERAGLVRRGRVAQSRPAHLVAAPMEGVAAWTEEFRRFWDERYDRLDDYLATMTDDERPEEGGERR
jgi:DNA-binding transcriptional ArsR family regulator